MKTSDIAAGASVLLVVCLWAGFWFGVGYVVWHFVSKFW